MKNSGSSHTFLSIKSIDMGDNSAEESSSFSVCKTLLDMLILRLMMKVEADFCVNNLVLLLEELGIKVE